MSEKDGPIGVYPMAVAFYTAYQYGGESGFPFPADLNERERGRFAQARRQICKALADNQRIDEDGGDAAVVVMFGRMPKNRGNASEMRVSLEAASLRAQLAAFYETFGVPSTP